MGRIELKPITLASKILLISGWRGVGKTSLCQRLVDSARLAGLDVAGVISPARVEAGQKTGIEVEDLHSGDRRLLASLLPGELYGTKLGPWAFNNEFLAWGNQALHSAVPCDILVIDELGPLEFDSGEGWTDGFQILDSLLYQLAIVVVRPEYTDHFLARWPGAEEIILSNPNEVDTLTRSLTDRFINNISIGVDV